MSNEEEVLDELVSKLEDEGVQATDTINGNVEIGSKVANVLNSVGVTPQRVQAWLGIDECGCKKRQKFLNGVLSFLKNIPNSN